MRLPTCHSFIPLLGKLSWLMFSGCWMIVVLFMNSFQFRHQLVEITGPTPMPQSLRLSKSVGKRSVTLNKKPIKIQSTPFFIFWVTSTCCHFGSRNMHCKQIRSSSNFSDLWRHAVSTCCAAVGRGCFVAMRGHEAGQPSERRWKAR